MIGFLNLCHYFYAMSLAVALFSAVWLRSFSTGSFMYVIISMLPFFMYMCLFSLM